LVYPGSDPPPGIEVRQGFFNAPDHLRLYFRAYLPERPRATVGVIHGYGDHSGRYLPTLGHLATLGYATHAFDYRGHGQSDGRRGYCDVFSDYLGDLEAFLERLRTSAGDGQLFLLAHSNGALITLLHALTRAPTVAGAIFTSPYLDLAFPPPPLKLAMARTLGRLVPWLPMPTGIPLDVLTHDREFLRATERDPLYNRKATPRWFFESRRAQAEVRGRAAEFRWHSLFLQGDSDGLASLPATRHFFDLIGSHDKELIVYPGFRHEILNEPEHASVWEDIDAWLESRLAPARPPTP
jgi:alpha-beta hydrolase superfamily lysophospholipase